MHEAGAHITQRCSATRSSRGEDAVDGSPVQGRDEAHRAAQLDHELVELRGPVLLRQQHRLRCQRGHRDVGPRGEGVALGDEHTERVQPEQLGGHRRWGQRGPPDADVEPPVHQTLELLGHTDLDLVDLQIGVLLLDLVQDQRHRVVAGIHDSHPQARP